MDCGLLRISRLMKRILAVIGVVAASAMAASAIQYQDIDSIANGTLSVGGTPISGTFNIRTGDGDVGDVWGYNPATQTIISAVAGFTFLDVNLTANTVSIALDGQSFISNGSVGQVLTSFNGAVLGNAYLTLNSTGEIGYTVELVSGDPITFVMAGLTAQAGDRVIGVPDSGATMGLLGLGLLASGWLGRRLRVRPATFENKD